jgi:nucleoredoxin
LATIEALYFFFRDYEVALNCGGKYADYNKKWDDLLWLYAYNY